MKFSLAGRIQTLGIEAVFDNVEASAWAVRPFAHKTTRYFCFCPGFSSWEKRRSDGSEAASSSSVLSSCSLSLSFFPGNAGYTQEAEIVLLSPLCGVVQRRRRF